MAAALGLVAKWCVLQPYGEPYDGDLFDEDDDDDDDDDETASAWRQLQDQLHVTAVAVWKARLTATFGPMFEDIGPLRVASDDEPEPGAAATRPRRQKSAFISFAQRDGQV